ncbi:MAG: transcriptional regulator [Nitrospirae bacterium]|nr:transcriptional regulator [Nitrospirota bacterium]
MKKKQREAFIPEERHETIRREIISLIERDSLSAREISGQVRISEKEVYSHLEHIQKTMSKKDHHLFITPSECLKCGFIFRKRDRIKKPGKCPVCRGELIQEPFFSIRLTI